MKDRGEGRQSPERGPRSGIRIQLPFDKGSSDNQQLQDTAKHFSYPSVGAMIHEAFSFHADAFLKRNRAEVLFSELPPQAFHTKVRELEIEELEAQVYGDPSQDRQVSVILPIEPGSREHWLFEAMAAISKKDRHAYSWQLTHPLIIRYLNSEDVSRAYEAEVTALEASLAASEPEVDDERNRDE